LLFYLDLQVIIHEDQGDKPPDPVTAVINGERRDIGKTERLPIYQGKNMATIKVHMEV
jgi:hypothetical protein